MNPKMKLVAGAARVSARLLAHTEIQNCGLEELSAPLVYGLVTSIGWDFKHTIEGIIIIFDINAALKLFSDTYIIEEKAIIAKFVQSMEPQDPFWGTSSSQLSKAHMPSRSSGSELASQDSFLKTRNIN